MDKLREAYPDREFLMSRFEEVFEKIEAQKDQLDTIKGEFNSKERSSVLELVVPILSATFRNPGVYTLVMHVDDTPVTSRILRVTLTTNKKDPLNR